MAKKTWVENNEEYNGTQELQTRMSAMITQS